MGGRALRKARGGARRWADEGRAAAGGGGAGGGSLGLPRAAPAGLIWVAEDMRSSGRAASGRGGLRRGRADLEAGGARTSRGAGVAPAIVESYVSLCHAARGEPTSEYVAGARAGCGWGRKAFHRAQSGPW